MSVALNIIDQDGTLVVSSETIADGIAAEHASVLRTIDNNLEDFEDFGGVRFEIRPFDTAGGMQSRRVALLSEPQATLLMTFMRNIGPVKDFKKALVHAFFDMARRLAVPAPQELTRSDLARMVLDAEAELTEAKTAVAELTPRAEAWDDFLTTDADYKVSDAAKMLARAGIETGQNRLFDVMHVMGWVYRGSFGKWEAKQTAVSSGYLVHKPQSHHHPRTGERVADAPQVRVTARGLERLRVRLGRGLMVAV